MHWNPMKSIEIQWNPMKSIEIQWLMSHRNAICSGMYRNMHTLDNPILATLTSRTLCLQRYSRYIQVKSGCAKLRRGSPGCVRYILVNYRSCTRCTITSAPCRSLSMMCVCLAELANGARLPLHRWDPCVWCMWTSVASGSSRLHNMIWDDWIVHSRWRGEPLTI